MCVLNLEVLETWRRDDFVMAKYSNTCRLCAAAAVILWKFNVTNQHKLIFFETAGLFWPQSRKSLIWYLISCIWLIYWFGTTLKHMVHILRDFNCTKIVLLLLLFFQWHMSNEYLIFLWILHMQPAVSFFADMMKALCIKKPALIKSKVSFLTFYSYITIAIITLLGFKQ